MSFFMKFAARKFLKDKIGAPANVIKLFEVYGFEAPKLDTVQKWYTRDSLSIEWFPLLLVLAEMNAGSPISLANYVSE
jgi:hypothetical protein